MSALVKAAKLSRVNRAHPGVFARYHRGDPGFLDGLWNGIKGAVGGFISGGPLGAVAGGVGGLIAGSKGASTGTSLVTRLQGQVIGSRPGVGAPAVNVGSASLAMPTQGLPPIFPGDKFHALPMGPGNTTQSQPTDWNPGSSNGGKTPCMRGYHWNKHGYYTKRYGWIEPMSVCVKNRKRNPLNPRAASRALARLTSTRKAMRGIERLMNRIGGSRPVRVAASSNGRRSSCGCRKR